MKAEAGEYLPHLRLQRVTIAHAELVFEFLITVGDVGLGGAGVV